MSNDLAIAAVTATLRSVLDAALHRSRTTPVGESTATTLRPDRLATAARPGLNVFLYRVSPNTGWTMTDLPARRADGSMRTPPRVALDLHYLVSAYGSDETLDSHRMLGRAVTALAVDAVLTPGLVAAELKHLAETEGLHFLSDADLADQLEPVRISPHVLTLDELGRLWSVFAQAPYELSVAYTASLVLLDADVDVADAPLPVRERRVTAAAGAQPRLDGMGTDTGDPVVRTGSVMVLRGSGLDGPCEVQVGPVSVQPGEADATRVTITIDARVPAGVHAVRVRRTVPLAGDAAAVAEGAAAAPETNALALAVRPTVSVGGSTDTVVTLAVVPAVQPGQRVMVTLTRLDPDPPQTRTYQRPPLPADSTPAGTVELDRASVPPGTWLVRIRVDDVESVPDLVDGRYGGPAFTVPPP